jgi:DNA-binding MarR family transcriptional regulator/ribosomal protein S18 acetylase RimI-like enzyme
MNTLTSEKINLLRHHARTVVRELGLLNDAYFDIGVTLAERHLLIELASCHGPTMKEIAERLVLDKSTVSRLIAKAMKKGYVTCTSDERDKRKRFLYLTEIGKKTLNAFEPIAFNQTKEALLTLATEEIELICQGIALYAKGLSNARLQNKSPLEGNPESSKIESLVEIRQRLAQLGFTLTPFIQRDERELYEIFREVVDAGNQFPYASNSIEEFHLRFFAPTSQVFVCKTAANQEIVGGFYLKSNFPGRSEHIANAAYMLKSSYRGQGIGALLVKASLEIAKELGFQAMQFNMVLSQNGVANKLYQKLGFKRAGTIPRAIRNPDGSYQEGYILYRELNN